MIYSGVFEKILLGILFSLLPIQAYTQTKSIQNFDHIVTLAFQQNLGLLSQNENTKSKQATEGAAFRQLLPNLSVSSNHNNSSEADSYYSANVNLSQPIYRPTLWDSWKKTSLSNKRADQTMQRLRQALLFELKSGWYELLTSQTLAVESQNALDRLKEHLNIAKHFYANGRIWQNDVLQAKVRVSRGEQTLLARQNRVTTAKRQLNILMHRKITAPIKANGKLEYTPIDQQISEMLSYAEQHRIELKQSQLDIKIAGHDVNIASAGMKPTVDLNLQRSFESTNANFSTSNPETLMSVSLKWNFWQWGKSTKEVSASKYSRRKLYYDYEQQKIEIEAEVHSVWLKLLEAEKNIHVLQQALDQSQENFRVSQLRYKEQLGSSSDVLDAQDLLTLTRIDYISALNQFLKSQVQLDFVVGVPVDELGQLSR